MKKIVFCLLATVSMMLFLQRTSAQINLEHTFEEPVYPASFEFLGDDGILIGCIRDNEANKQYKLFNTDYSLYKIIDVTLFAGYPAGYNAYYANYFTRKLFNDNNKIEFIVVFYNKTEHGGILMRIYDEDGTIIKDFGETTSESNYSIFKINDQYKLFWHKNDLTTDSYTTEIYSIPGKISNIAPLIGNNIFQSPYPNPANSIITLPYQLKQGEISTMRIYNMNGQLIETKQIDSAFDKILLNVSNYKRGMYLYEVNGESKRFIVK